jgi:hypothetical protein
MRIVRGAVLVERAELRSSGRLNNGCCIGVLETS